VIRTLLPLLTLITFGLFSGAASAAKLDGQNDATVIAGRARRLRAVGEEKRARFTRRF